MADNVVNNPELARRFDLLAVSRPHTVRRSIWISLFLVVWTSIGSVSALAAQHWGIAAMLVPACALSVLLCWASLRAKRRVPATKEWLAELSGE